MIPYAKKWGDCHRMFLLADYLQQNNFNVTVVHSNLKYYGDFGQRFQFETFSFALKKRLFVSSFSVNDKKDQPLKKSPLIKLVTDATYWKDIIKYKFLRRILLAIENWFFEDINPGDGWLGYFWIRHNRKKILDIIAQNQVEKVIISCPPFSLASLVPYLKKRTAAQLFLDFRDPWLSQKDTRFYRKQKKVLEASDHVFLFSEKFRNSLSNHFNGLEYKSSELLNAYSIQNWAGIDSKSNLSVNSSHALVISYCGGYNLQNGPLNLQTVLNAIHTSSLKNDVLLRLIGPIPHQQIAVWKEKMGESIDFIDTVSHQKSLEYMLESDVLLVSYLSNEDKAKYMLTTKFFDYIRAKRVIWGIGNENMNFMEMIREFNLGLCSSADNQSITAGLKQLVQLKQNDRLEELRISIRKTAENS